MAFTGTQAKAELANAKTTADVDRLVKSWAKNGNVPSYLKDDDWTPVTVKGGGHTLVYNVMPDYWAVGTNADPFPIGRESPFAAQYVADEYDSILPSAKMLRDIQSAASTKFAYTDVKAAPDPKDRIALKDIETPRALDVANKMRKEMLDMTGISPQGGGANLIGYRKAIIVAPKLDGKRVAIYGGRWGAGADSIIQPVSTIHDSTYSDYSHGIVLVSKKATLDGKSVNLDDVFTSKDPTIVALVSDVGPFVPYFPNVDNIGSAFTPDAIAAKKETSGGGAAATSTQAAVMTYVPAVLAGAGAAAAATLLGLTAWPVVGVGIVGGIIGRWLTRT